MNEKYEFHEIRFDENDKMSFNERDGNQENVLDRRDGKAVDKALILRDFPL